MLTGNLKKIGSLELSPFPGMVTESLSSDPFVFFYFYFFSRNGFHYVAQAGFELLGSSDPLSFASQSAGTAGVSHTGPGLEWFSPKFLFPALFLGCWLSGCMFSPLQLDTGLGEARNAAWSGVSSG